MQFLKINAACGLILNQEHLSLHEPASPILLRKRFNGWRQAF